MSVKFLSNSIKYIFLSFIIVSFSLITLSWINAPNGVNCMPYFSFNVIGERYKIMYEMSAAYKILGFLLTLAYSSFSFTIYWMLYKLFDAFSKEEFFSLKVIILIKRVGFLYLIKELVAPFYEALFSFFATYQNPKGHGILTVSFDPQNLENILLGLILFVAARIMSEGFKLKQGSQLTV